MTNDSPIRSATLQSMVEALESGRHRQVGTFQNYPIMVDDWECAAKDALRALLQSADGKAIREALEWVYRITPWIKCTPDSIVGECLANVEKSLALLTALEKECL